VNPGEADEHARIIQVVTFYVVRLRVGGEEFVALCEIDADGQ
jgi:hypothetical protein